MSHSIADESKLLVENLSLLESLSGDNGILDLACGSGRNGLCLLKKNMAVTFADKNQESLSQVAQSIDKLKAANTCEPKAEIWQVDLEQTGTNPLAGRLFDGVLVFNYLHRPLIPAIKQIITKAGLIFYETFTVQQTKFGRPTNPEFLLKENELLEAFADWEIIDYFEGIKTNPECAKASIIARKLKSDG